MSNKLGRPPLSFKAMRARAAPTRYQDPPTPEDKGVKGGSCNRSHCVRPASAFYYNHGTRLYYCRRCADELNRANRDAVGVYGHPLCTLDPDFIEQL